MHFRTVLCNLRIMQIPQISIQCQFPEICSQLCGQLNFFLRGVSLPSPLHYFPFYNTCHESLKTKLTCTQCQVSSERTGDILTLHENLQIIITLIMPRGQANISPPLLPLWPGHCRAQRIPPQHRECSSSASSAGSFTMVPHGKTALILGVSSPSSLGGRQ